MAIYLAFALYFLTIPSTLAAFEATTKTERELLIFHRAKKVLELMKLKSCKELTAGQNCTILSQRSPELMNFYMAEKVSERSTLTMRVPLRPSPFELYKDLDAVVIVDPMPDAHFGHVIVMTLIKVGVTKEFCDRRKGSYYRSPVSEPECMYLPSNNGRCLFMAQLKPWKNLRKACSFDFIPFVYDTSDVAKQQLRCYSKIPKFGPCPKMDEVSKHKCRNKLCSKEINRGGFNGEKSVCGWSCDYALLLSGGWSKYTNRIRHLHNLQDMYRHLNKHRSFDEKNIKVFFANNSTIKLGDDTKAKVTVPAVDASTITRHVENVCSKDTKCIDTFVIYLNGPTTKNGDLLLWDWNEDGKASKAEILPIEQLFSPLQICNAKNFLIIADQNYAGHVVQHVRKGRRLGKKNYDKIHVLTASNENSYSFKRDFTKMFIRFDNNELDGKTNMKSFARRISSIAKDLKSAPLLRQYNVHYLKGSNKDLTLTGEYGLEGGCS